MKRLFKRTVRFVLALVLAVVFYRFLRSQSLSFVWELFKAKPAVVRPAASKPSPSTPLLVPQAVTEAPGPKALSANQATDEASEEFVAMRYDDSRVLFFAGGVDPPEEKPAPGPQTIGKSATDLPNLSLQDMTDATAAAAKKLLSRVPLGEEWQLLGASELPLPLTVLIEKPVVTGNIECGTKIGIGFLARINPVGAMQFAASPRSYFVVRPSDRHAGAVQESKASQASQLTDWAPTEQVKDRLEQLLNLRMKDEIPQMRTKVASAYQRGIEQHKNWPAEWKKYDSALERGEAKLEYDLQAFRLTPDGVPRLFVRAKWTVSDKTIFLMSLWLRTGSVLAVEAQDSSLSINLRSQEYQGEPVSLDSLGKILNVFGPAQKTWGDLLIYTPGYEGFEMRLFHYTDSGPVRKETAYVDGC